MVLVCSPCTNVCALLFALHLGQRRGESQRLHLRCLCLAAATDLGCLRDPASAAPRTLARSMQPSRAREQSAAGCEKLARGRLPFSSAVCARCGLMAARLPKAKAIGRIANVARTLPLRSAPDLRFVGERVWSWGWQIGTAVSTKGTVGPILGLGARDTASRPGEMGFAAYSVFIPPRRLSPSGSRSSARRADHPAGR